MPVGDEDGVALAVAIDLAASARRCTSSSVRYSRVRTSAFFGRTGMTIVRFTIIGDVVLTAILAMFCARFHRCSTSIAADVPSLELRTQFTSFSS
jgi:hypothetical protein